MVKLIKVGAAPALWLALVLVAAVTAGVAAQGPTCGAGYDLQAGKCVDIDECALGTADCRANSHCENTDGDYNCICDQGYSGDGKTACIDNKECDLSSGLDNGGCSGNSTCAEVDGSYTCVCDDGFEYDPDTDTCVDIDECARDGDTLCGNIDPSATCNNTVGNFECICSEGFSWNDASKQCENINECTTLWDANVPNDFMHDCDANAVCSDNTGSQPGYTCTCKDGWVGDGKSCSNIDECALSRFSCPANSACSDTPGGYECVCAAGYSPTRDANNVVISCVDDNECSNNPCPANSVCENTPGSYKCNCNQYYTMVKGVCKAQNMCLVNNGGCPGNSTCVYNPGNAPTCSCNAGFSGSPVSGQPLTACQDINECITKPAATYDCVASAAGGVCTNTPGRWSCACKKGYTGNGRLASFPGGTGCTDIDECTVVKPNGGCDINAKCTNIAGSRTCSCKKDYVGNGTVCTAVNRCLVNNGGCDSVRENCVFLGAGSRRCDCKAGYVRYTSTGACQVDNACVAFQNRCGAGVDCTSTGPGTFSCSCKDGYTRIGSAAPYTCQDINECKIVGMNDCSAYASCANALPPAKFKCTCKTCFSDSTGTGRSCRLPWTLGEDLTNTVFDHYKVRANQYVRLTISVDSCTNDTPNKLAKLFAWGWPKVLTDRSCSTGGAKIMPAPNTGTDRQGLSWDGPNGRYYWTWRVPADAKPGKCYTVEIRLADDFKNVKTVKLLVY